MSTIFTISHWREVHEIVVKTQAGRVCIILLHDDENDGFQTNILIADTLSSRPGTWDFQLDTTTPVSTAREHFEESLNLIGAYLQQFSANDEIVSANNPFQTPFLSEGDQNAVLKALGYPFSVTVD